VSRQSQLCTLPAGPASSVKKKRKEKLAEKIHGGAGMGPGRGRGRRPAGAWAWRGSACAARAGAVSAGAAAKAWPGTRTAAGRAALDHARGHARTHTPPSLSAPWHGDAYACHGAHRGAAHACVQRVQHADKPGTAG